MLQSSFAKWSTLFGSDISAYVTIVCMEPISAFPKQRSSDNATCYKLYNKMGSKKMLIVTAIGESPNVGNGYKDQIILVN